MCWTPLHSKDSADSHFVKQSLFWTREATTNNRSYTGLLAARRIEIAILSYNGACGIFTRHHLARRDPEKPNHGRICRLFVDANMRGS